MSDENPRVIGLLPKNKPTRLNAECAFSGSIKKISGRAARNNIQRVRFLNLTIKFMGDLKIKIDVFQIRMIIDLIRINQVLSQLFII